MAWLLVFLCSHSHAACIRTYILHILRRHLQDWALTAAAVLQCQDVADVHLYAGQETPCIFIYIPVWGNDTLWTLCEGSFNSIPCTNCSGENLPEWSLK